MAKQDDYTRYTVRIPSPLYERVSRSAEESQRSVNAEIVATLEEKYPAPKPEINFHSAMTEATSILTIKDKAERTRLMEDLNSRLARGDSYLTANMLLAFSVEEGDPPGLFVSVGPRHADDSNLVGFVLYPRGAADVPAPPGGWRSLLTDQ